MNPKTNPLRLQYPVSHSVETKHSMLQHLLHSIILYPMHPSPNPNTVVLTNNQLMY